MSSARVISPAESTVNVPDPADVVVIPSSMPPLPNIFPFPAEILT